MRASVYRQEYILSSSGSETRELSWPKLVNCISVYAWYHDPPVSHHVLSKFSFIPLLVRRRGYR